MNSKEAHLKVHNIYVEMHQLRGGPHQSEVTHKHGGTAVTECEQATHSEGQGDNNSSSESCLNMSITIILTKKKMK